MPSTIYESRITAAYRTVPALYDEMVGPDGEIRPSWQPLAAHMNALGAAGLERRNQQAVRQIAENGVTYNVYEDPRGMDRPWTLDTVPLMISPDEWRLLEQGMIQRARLMDALLQDIYGPQQLIRDGLLPPDLVWGNPGFLRECHGLQRPGRRHITFFAADLARSREGRWWFLSDRAQAPSGSGYTLENRLVLSRTLSSLYADCNVQRLAPFFAGFRNTLVQMTPRTTERPRIILLTPGPYNETYFEHVYLSRYLGLTLAEGGDLTVRDNKVYLKTLSGLRQVDVILRRIDDVFCDPLAFREDSAIGVAGLVQAVYAGNVAVVNALGAGVVESPGLMPFLPGLCRAVFQQEEILPYLAAWWCGQQRERDYVIDNLDRLVVKPAYPGIGMDPRFGEHLSAAEREALIRRLHDRPADFVGQERLDLSTAPVWEDGELVPRHIVLRMYAAWDEERGEFRVMPGGLSRTSPNPESPVTSMQQGGGSKDTWVLSDQPVPVFSLLPLPGEAGKVNRVVQDLPSRVADNLFWMGRYLERSEALIRLVRVIASRLADEGAREEVPDLLRLLHRQAELPKKIRTAPPVRQLVSALYDRERPGSLTSVFQVARRLASILRDRISADTWRIFIMLDQEMAQGEQAGTDLTELMRALDRMVVDHSALAGLSEDAMIHAAGWRLMDMGRRLERAILSSALFRGTLLQGETGETARLDALLEVMVSEMTYRSRYHTRSMPLPVLDLLMFDDSNPRSLVYQLQRLDTHVGRLPRREMQPRTREEERIAFHMAAMLRLAVPEELVRRTEGHRRVALDALLQELDAQLPRLSDVITAHYLSHIQAAKVLQHLTPFRPDTLGDGE